MRVSAVTCVVLCACGGGGKWVHAAPLPNSAVKCPSVVMVGDALFVGNEHGLAKSPDDGVSWAEATNGLPHPNGFSTVEALIQDQDTLLAGTDDGIYASTDNAATWVNASAGFPTDVSAYAFFLVGHTALAGTNTGSTDTGRTGGVFRSPDQGVSWAMSSTGLPMGDGAVSFAQLGSKVFTCFGMDLASSTDNGQSWTMSPSPGGSNCLWLVSDATNLYAATANAGVFRSTDGATWTAASKGLPSSDIVSTLFIDVDKLYAGTGTSGVFVSSDTGKSWSKFSDGFGAAPPRVVQFAIHGTVLIAVTDADGVWRRQL